MSQTSRRNILRSLMIGPIFIPISVSSKGVAEKRFIISMDLSVNPYSVFVVEAKSEEDAFEKAINALVERKPTLILDKYPSIKSAGFCYSISGHLPENNILMVGQHFSNRGCFDQSAHKRKIIHPNAQEICPIVLNVVERYKNHPKILKALV